MQTNAIGEARRQRNTPSRASKRCHKRYTRRRQHHRLHRRTRSLTPHKRSQITAGKRTICSAPAAEPHHHHPRGSRTSPSLQPYHHPEPHQHHIFDRINTISSSSNPKKPSSILHSHRRSLPLHTILAPLFTFSQRRTSLFMHQLILISSSYATYSSSHSHPTSCSNAFMFIFNLSLFVCE